MENLLDAVRALKVRRRETGQPSLETLKATYNELLQRHKVLEAYLDDNSIPLETREGKLDDFQDILRRLNQLLSEIRRSGQPIETEEVLNGFR
jgi:hypothetical protein